MLGQRTVKEESSEQDMDMESQCDTTTSMQDITACILQKEHAYLARIERLLKVVAEQAEKVALYKQRAQESKDALATREEAEQIMLQAAAKTAQNEVDMELAEMVLQGADMKLHNAQAVLAEANKKMAEAQTMIELARKIKQENQHLVSQLDSYHIAPKRCSQSMISELNEIEAKRSPTFATFPLVPRS